MNAEYIKNETAVVQQTEEKKPISKSDKVAEKLNALREKLGKAVETQTAAEKKAKDLKNEIAKCEKILHDEEVRRLDNVCSERKLTYDEIIAFITAVTGKMTIYEAAELLDLRIRKDDINDR
ncbi:MAG: hypothetical protein J6K17_04120 [Oscillospiraceae bacterium]|nr:hypothetical protein [Oscillospiraceae bacterium]